VLPWASEGAERDPMARFSSPGGGDEEKTGLAPGTRRGGEEAEVI
jgi:hypothetical protein